MTVVPFPKSPPPQLGQSIQEWLSIELWLHDEKQVLLMHCDSGRAAKVQKLIGIAAAEIAALRGEFNG